MHEGRARETCSNGCVPEVLERAAAITVPEEHERVLFLQ
jgi:hypothetical protein